MGGFAEEIRVAARRTDGGFARCWALASGGEYSRDKRPDCLQLVIALVVTAKVYPLAYEVMKGNTSDRTTLEYRDDLPGG